MYNIADTSVTIIVISYHQNRDLGFHDVNWLSERPFQEKKAYA